MISRVLSSLVCVLCLILLPVVWADYCYSYWDMNGRQYDHQNCYNQYCCGSCTQKYCCNDKRYRLSEEKQQYCSDGGSSTNSDKKKKLSTLLGSILGSIFPIILCVGLIICCVAPCCFCYKKCRKGGNQGHAPGRNMPVAINTPLQPVSPQQPGYPGYQPVPFQPGFGGTPHPAAPPPYFDANGPSPLYPRFPGQVYAEPPSSGEHAQPAYNPSYDPKSETG